MPNQDELLAKLKALGIPSAATSAPDVAPPPEMSRQPFLQAQYLDEQAKPQKGPGGILGGLRAGLEGFTGGYTGGPGYFEHQQARDAQERQRQQDLIGRAKELRQEGLKQEEINRQVDAEARAREIQTGQLEETKRLRAVQEAQASSAEKHQRAMEAAAANKMEFAPAGSQPFKQGQPAGPQIPKESDQKPQHVAGLLDGKQAFASFHDGKFYDPNTQEDISARFKPVDPSTNVPPQVLQAEGPEGPAFYRIPRQGPTGLVKDVEGNVVTPKAVGQAENQARAADATMKMVNIVRGVVKQNPGLIGPAVGRMNEGLLHWGGDVGGVMAEASSMPEGAEKQAALLSGHLAYLFMNEARAALGTGRPSKEYMDYVRQHSAAMSQNPQVMEGYLQSAENNAKIAIQGVRKPLAGAGGPAAAPTSTPTAPAQAGGSRQRIKF